MKLGAKRDGTLTAILMRLDADTGPYGQHCLTVPMNAISKSLPLFLCDNARFEVKSYYTKPLARRGLPGLRRAQGAPSPCRPPLAELAGELGLDQLDVIEKNRVRSGRPHRHPQVPGRGPRGRGGHARRMRPRRDDPPRPRGLRVVGAQAGLAGPRLEDRPRRGRHPAGLGPARPRRGQRGDTPPRRRDGPSPIGRGGPRDGPRHGHRKDGRGDPRPRPRGRDGDLGRHRPHPPSTRGPTPPPAPSSRARRRSTRPWTSRRRRWRPPRPSSASRSPTWR